MVLPAQIGVFVLTVGVAGMATIVMAIEFDAAGLPVTDVKLDVIEQVTDCPEVRVVVVKVGLFVPAFTPFTFHWYDGVVPPLVGVAVNVADAPAHSGLVPAV